MTYLKYLILNFAIEGIYMAFKGDLCSPLKVSEQKSISHM